MKVLFFVLNREELLEEVLEAFLELNIPGATILDSVGMASIITHDIPIFAGFRNLMEGSQPANKTIMTVVKDNMVEKIVQALEQIVGPLDQPGNGILFTIPVDKVYGIRKSKSEIEEHNGG